MIRANTPPAVSILLPVRNGESTLERAVRSCLNQTFSDFELLVADDGSTDDTRLILERLASTDGRVNIVDVERPGGLAAALNVLVEAASAPLLARMDADDVAYPERLAVQVELMSRRPELAACGCGVRIVGSVEDPSGVPRPGFLRYQRWINALTEPEAIARERFIESPLVHPTVIIRADALREAGGYRDTPWAEDYDLWLRMLERGMKIAKSPRVLFDWSDGPDRLTRRDSRYSEARFLEARVHYIARIDAVRSRGVMISGAGPTGKRLARGLQERDIRIHAFLDVHPRRTGVAVLGTPVLGPDEAPPASPDAPVQLSAVGRAGRREAVRTLLRSKGYEEGLNFFCLA